MVHDDNSRNGDSNNRVERLQVMLDGSELAALDDFRFKLRMPSRAAAVRELLKRGLAAEGFIAADVGMKSAEFGVIDRDEDEPEPPRGRGNGNGNGNGNGRRRADT
jgi:hypothetical protein